MSGEFEKKNVQILGVSFDTVSENAAFARKYDFPYPLLCDVDRRIGIAYGAADSASATHASRISYVIDPQGRIAQAHAKVTPKSHASEILASL